MSLADKIKYFKADRVVDPTELKEEYLRMTTGYRRPVKTKIFMTLEAFREGWHSYFGYDPARVEISVCDGIPNFNKPKNKQHENHKRSSVENIR